MFDISTFDEWAKCAYIILAGVLIQQFLSRVVYPFIGKRLEQKHVSQAVNNILLNSVARPLNFLIIMTAIYAGLNTTPLHAFSPALFLHIYRTTIIISFYGVFYNLFDSNEGQLAALTRKFGWHLDKLLINLGSSVLRMLVLVFGFLTVAKEWDYDMSGVIAGLGLGGLALAMASKDSLSNIFGGFVILTDKPFTIGDWVNAAGYEGGVEDVSFRSTRIRTIDQGIVYVPNTNMANVPITNFSRRTRRRASFSIGLDYATSKEQLSECIKKIRQMLDEHAKITHGAGDTLVVFSGYGESSLNIAIIYFTATADYNEYMLINDDIYFIIMDIVNEIGSSFAFPSRSLYIQDPIVFKAEKEDDDVNEERGQQE